MGIDECVKIVGESIQQDIFELSQKEQGASLIRVEGLQETTAAEEQSSIQKLLSTSLVGENYQPPDTKSSKRQKKKKQREERERTAGPGWFNLPATTVTPEIERDLQVLQMRNLIFKDRFYKKSDPLPKYFQVGTVVDAPVDYYSSRLTKKQRSTTFVDELLKDSEFKKYTKKKYLELQKQNASGRNNRRNFKKKPVWRK